MTIKLPPAEFYELVQKYHLRQLPPLGFEFRHSAKGYVVIGVVQAGDKLRAKGEDGKVYLFPIKGFVDKYKVPK